MAEDKKVVGVTSGDREGAGPLAHFWGSDKEATVTFDDGTVATASGGSNEDAIKNAIEKGK
jgi:hypothetical protein